MEKAKKVFTYLLFSLINGYLLGTGLVLSKLFYKPIYNDGNIFEIQSVKELNLIYQILFTAIFTVGFLIVFVLRQKVLRQTLPLCIAAFALLVFLNSEIDRPYTAITLAVIAAAFVLAFKDITPEDAPPLLTGKAFYIVIGAAAVFLVFLTSLGTVCRHLAFESSDFDFGIFAQMYESMARDLSQTTTLERGAELSHFAVHFSPVYYLLLPGYMIFRCPEYLLVMQSLIAYSGIIPLLLLCRRWKYSENITLLISIVFMFYPAITSPCFYDFHENVFLVPFLLYLLYFIEKNSTAGIAVSVLLLLCVKEEVGLYIVIIGIYALLGKRCSKRNSIMMLIMGAAGFAAATSVVRILGDGIMSDRYAVFMNRGEESLMNVVTNVIRNPAVFLNILLSEDKLLLVVQMLLPLLFIPIMTGKLSDWVLTAPFIIINLATDYYYQFSLDFQYVFGTGVLLFFLFAKNTASLKSGRRMTAAAAIAAVICFAGFNPSKYNYIDKYLNDSKYDYAAAEEVLDAIPRDAVVIASNFISPHLSDVPKLYSFAMAYDLDEIEGQASVYDENINYDTLNADYIILDSRLEFKYIKYKSYIDDMTADGYEIISGPEVSFAVVLKKTDKNPNAYQ